MRRGVNLCVFLSPTSNIPCQVAEDMRNAYGSAVIQRGEATSAQILWVLASTMPREWSCHGLAPSQRHEELFQGNMKMYKLAFFLSSQAKSTFMANKDSLWYSEHQMAGQCHACWCRDHLVNAPSQWETTLHYNVISHWLRAYQLAYTQNDPCDDLAMLPTKPGDAWNQVWLAAKWFMIEFQTIIHLKQQLFTNIWTRKYIYKQTTIRSSRTTNVQHWFKILKLDYYIDKQPPYYWKMKL